MIDDDVMIPEDQEEEGDSLPLDCILIFVDDAGAPEISVRGRFMDLDETVLTLDAVKSKLMLSRYRAKRKQRGGF